MTPVELTPPPGRTGAGTWHALGPFLRPQWPALAGAGGSTVVLALTELAKPWPLAIVIDHIVRGREGSFALQPQDLRLLALVVALILAIALAEALAQYLADRWLLSAGERITHTLRIAVYTHLHRLSLGFHQRRHKGDLVARVTADVNAVGDLFAQSLGTIAQDILLLLGMAAVTLTIDPVLAVVSFVAAPALGILSFSYRRRVRQQSRIQRAQEGEIASLANEALSAMAVVKAHGSERFERARVHSRSAERMRVGLSVSRLQARFDGIIGVVNAAAMALVIVVGVQRIAAGLLSAGELIVFAQYVRRLNSPLREMAREGTKLARTMARADRVAEILSADDLLDERPGAHHGPAATGDIELEHVTFGYDPERPVLDDVSLHVPAGSCVAVVGESGAGKSTIGALVARFYDPSAGRLLIDGRDARDCALAWLRAQVGMVLQETVLFSGTVAENIAYGTGAGMAEIMAAARVAAADEFIRALPDGYDTELSPQGAGLSGGQRQRIGIARTLVRDPRILVLDEPTTGLDAESEAEVVAGLLALMRSRTTLLITHSVELARRADQVVVLAHGRIVAQGPPEVVLARGGLVEEDVGSQRTDAALVAPEGEAAA